MKANWSGLSDHEKAWAVGVLSSRQLEVVRLSETMSQRSIALALGISRERVRQHQKEALRRLMEATK